MSIDRVKGIEDAFLAQEVVISTFKKAGDSSKPIVQALEMVLAAARLNVADTAETILLSGETGSEARVVSELRLEASQRGMRLWRNNCGAFYDQNGSFIRFGLGNDSKQFNTVCKSSDLIGIEPRIIRPEHIGQTWGVFVAREAKKPGWVFTGIEREVGQLNFINLVNQLGGDAAFATGRGSFKS